MLFQVCYGACALTYLMLAGVIVVQAKRSTASWLLVAASLSNAAWAATTAIWGIGPNSPASLVDLVRAITWYGAILYLYHQAVDDLRNVRLFAGLGVALLVIGAAMLTQDWSDSMSLVSGGILLRLLLAIGQLVLLENLYRGSHPDLRWHVGLACLALGSLSLYELFVIGDAVLAHRLSHTLVEGRAVAAILAAPLLAVAAARNRSWGVALHASRTAVLHTATLIGSGVFLLSLSAVAEMLQRTSWAPGSDWPGLLQVALIFSGLLAIATLLISASTRHWLARLVSDHFFTYRYDYRREWLRCIATLSRDDATDPGGLPRRAIRAIADVVDSPAGLLLSGQPDQAGLSWAGSWNMPAVPPIPPEHPLLGALAGGTCLKLPAELRKLSPMGDLGFWLAVPLTTRDHALSGCILLAPPRGPFRLDDEVFALLGVLSREVATHLAEQQATRTLMETRDLRVYGERFAFVAHDIKNVAGQLRLLTANAERHLANPAFQRDMLATVEASVQKIGNLIRRLETTEGESTADGSGRQASFDLLPRIEAAVKGRNQAGLHFAPPEGANWQVRMADVDFQAVLTHLLDNAITAAGSGGSVGIALSEQQQRILVDIADDGPGMTPEFVRDELFRPFSTRTVGGSGIGAFQARELLRRAGGDLLVLSQPGKGTTMRLLLPRPLPEQSPVPAIASA